MPAAHPPEFRRPTSDRVAQGNSVVQTAEVPLLTVSGSTPRGWTGDRRSPGRSRDDLRQSA